MRADGWELSIKQWVLLFILLIFMIIISDITAFIGASLLAFIPAYMYLKSIRNTEQHDKEPWEALKIAFAWGAISGVFLALLLSALGVPLLLFLLADLTDPSVHDILPVIVGAVIVAPIVEEFAKPLVMFLSIVGAVTWVLWSFLRWFWRWQESNLLRDFRIEEVKAIEATKQSTRNHAIERIFEPELFKLLSDDQKKFVIEGLGSEQKLLESPELKGALS